MRLEDGRCHDVRSAIVRPTLLVFVLVASALRPDSIMIETPWKTSMETELGRILMAKIDTLSPDELEHVRELLLRCQAAYAQQAAERRAERWGERRPDRAA